MLKSLQNSKLGVEFLARDGGIGPLLHFRGKIHGERPTGFVASPPS